MRTLVGLSLSWAVSWCVLPTLQSFLGTTFLLNFANMALWSRETWSSKISSDLQSCSFTKYPENVNFASPQSSAPQFLIISICSWALVGNVDKMGKVSLGWQSGPRGQDGPWWASAGCKSAAAHLHCREKTKTLSDNWENNHGKKYNWENSWQQSQGNWRVWTDLCSADRCKCG